MIDLKRILAGVAATAVAGGLMLSVTAPAMADTNVHRLSAITQASVHPETVYGPYSSEFTCNVAGWFGVASGAWLTYDCVGSGNVWWLYTID